MLDPLSAKYLPVADAGAINLFLWVMPRYLTQANLLMLMVIRIEHVEQAHEPRAGLSVGASSSIFGKVELSQSLDLVLEGISLILLL